MKKNIFARVLSVGLLTLLLFSGCDKDSGSKEFSGSYQLSSISIGKTYTATIDDLDGIYCIFYWYSSNPRSISEEDIGTLTREGADPEQYSPFAGTWSSSKWEITFTKNTYTARKK